MSDHNNVRIGIGPLYPDNARSVSSIQSNQIELANIPQQTSTNFYSPDYELKGIFLTSHNLPSSIQSNNSVPSFLDDIKVSEIRKTDLYDVSLKSHCKDFAQGCCSLSRRDVRSIRHIKTKTWIICGGVTAVIGIFIFVGFRIASTMKNG